MNLFDGIFPGSNGIANTLIDMFGDKASIIISDNNNYDPSTGEINNYSETIYEVLSSPILQYNIKDYTSLDLLTNDSLNILRGDSYCLINADTLHKQLSEVDFMQLKDAKIEVNNGCYDIITVNPIYSGKEVACYKLQLRN